MRAALPTFAVFSISQEEAERVFSVVIGVALKMMVPVPAELAIVPPSM